MQADKARWLRVLGEPVVKLDPVEFGLTVHQPRRTTRTGRQGMLLAILFYGGMAALWALRQAAA